VCAAAAVAILGALSGCETTSKPVVPPSSGTLPTAARPVVGETFDLSRLDQTPVPRFQARPQYPAELRKRGVGGEAVVDFIVDVNGDVRGAYAIRATHGEFAKAAVECVEKWKFTPGRKGGRDVNTHMQVPIVFTLNAR
ncbi:MAG: energy transducer TonB, partial [Opitutaceae bacterium]|nr:energy transducer TonB [Opitutaceae bacterium]